MMQPTETEATIHANCVSTGRLCIGGSAVKYGIYGTIKGIKSFNNKDLGVWRWCHVWMAPFMQGFFRLMLIVTESGHVSGLLARYALPLALPLGIAAQRLQGGGLSPRTGSQSDERALKP